MEKILLAVNSHQIDTNTTNFACYIAKITNSKLTALLLREREPELISADRLNNSFYKKVMDVSVSDRKYIQMDLDQEVRFFLKTCEKNGVQGEVILKRENYEDNDSPADEAIRASRFADLLILDAETSFDNEIEPLPTAFVKKVISDSECPVLIAPTSFDRIDDIVFCYDGSRSSVFAIKQFTYVFPELLGKNVIVLEVGSENKTKHKEQISSWLRGNYNKIEFHELEGVPSEELFKYFFMKKNLFVVMGAYGRSDISNLFRKSSADLLVRTIDLPLFISHH